MVHRDAVFTRTSWGLSGSLSPGDDCILVLSLQLLVVFDSIIHTIYICILSAFFWTSLPSTQIHNTFRLGNTVDKVHQSRLTQALKRLSNPTQIMNLIELRYEEPEFRDIIRRANDSRYVRSCKPSVSARWSTIPFDNLAMDHSFDFKNQDFHGIKRYPLAFVQSLSRSPKSRSWASP